jgi:hypothetical protein
MFEGAFPAAVIRDGPSGKEEGAPFVVRDLWKDGQRVPSDADGFSAEVPPHDIGIFRVSTSKGHRLLAVVNNQ